MLKTVIFAILIILVLIIILVFGALYISKAINRTDEFSDRENLAKKYKYAFIINPSKVNAKKVEEEIIEICHEYGAKDFMIYYTTVEDPGTSQTNEAINDGADVIVAVGGDGTVRVVAATMFDKKTAANRHAIFGVVPNGTGNIYARNLRIPIGDTRSAMEILFYGKTKMLDMCWLKFKNSDIVHAVMVIAGIGFDSKLVLETNPELKKSIKFFAYFLSGVKSVRIKRFNTSLTLEKDGKTLVSNTSVKSLMFGNCGKLPGFTLIPDAELDDGMINVVTIDNSKSLIGWAALFTQVSAQTLGLTNGSNKKLSRIEHIKTSKINVKLKKPIEVQVDGDLVGESMDFDVWSSPAVLNTLVS